MDEESNAPLLGSRANSTNDEVTLNYRYRYYTLPAIRYTNAVRVLLFLDAVTCIALWAAGGNGKEFVDSIIHFNLFHSTFDLACLATLKCFVLFIMYTKLESTTQDQLQDPFNITTNQRKRVLHMSIIILSLMTFTFPVVKGGLILNKILNDSNYDQMSLVHNIQLIAAAIFSLIEFIFALFSGRAMYNLKLARIIHRLNENHQEVDEEGKVIQPKVNIIRLMSLVKAESLILTLGCLCLLGSTAAQTASPLFFGKVVDAAQRSMAELNRTVFILLGIYIAGAIMGMLRSFLFTLAGQRMVARLRKVLFTSIIQQEVAFFDVNRTGELTNRLSSDSQVIQNAVTVNISMLARYTLQIIGSLGFMFALHASLTGVLLAVVPIISLGAVQYGKFVMRIRQNFQDRLADASATAEDSISSIRTVRSFVAEEKASQTYSVSVDESYKEGKKLAIASGGFDGMIGMIIAGATTLVLWYGGKLLNEKQITPGVLTSFLLYTITVAFAFGLLSSLYGDFMQAVGASVRIFELMDREPVVSNKGGIQLDNLNGGLEFDQVQFTYPSRPDNQVLKSVSFSVETGQMVALVGPSGGGKSTIVSMIERFYDPDNGVIKLSGVELKTLDPQWFRRRMSVVSQEPTLFGCSIRDNIAYGRDATLDEIQAVARLANAEEFIQTFEEGYDTKVGERGVRLSGGQKQRVAIARALLMNPDILLLDEATSALDAESEFLVQEAIDRAMVNRTVLVIAHRLSTVRNANKVIVISKGEIVEEGTHDELIDKNGTYKKLVLRQLTAGKTNLDGSDVENFDNHTNDDHVTSSDLINMHDDH